MYRIVIAEDEEEVRKSIIRCIDASEHYEVVGEARDGLEAVEQIQKKMPDILVTDICMPRLDGLELIRRVTEACPEIETVIISGYDEFRYVKEAMQLGVQDYLLKPFLPGELFKILDKIGEKLTQQKILRQNMEAMHQQIERSREYTTERFVRGLLSGNCREEEQTDIRFNLCAKWYAVCVARLRDSSGEKSAGDAEKLVKQCIQMDEDHYFVSALEGTSLTDEHGQIVLLFAGMQFHSEHFLRDIREGMEKIGKSMERYYGLRIQCTLGSAVPDYKNADVSYREALVVWKGVYNQEQTVVQYTGPEEKGGEEKPDEAVRESLRELERQLLLAIQQAEKEQALESLDEILKCYAKFPVQQFPYVSVSIVNLVLSISGLASRETENVHAWDDESVLHFLENNMKYGSLQEARKILADYVEKSCARFEAIHETQGNRVVNMACSFVELNLDNEALDLTMVAEALHFSPNYIRQLFKSVCGENFSDYVFRKRMEKAAELLKASVCKIQEIAERTGYSNQRYFARCFKKYYNCTPTEYKEKNS